MQYREDAGGPATDCVATRPDAERLQAALEALAARDQVLADRTRRLAALEDVSSRLAVVAAQLQTAQEELAALHRARAAETAERQGRLTELEHRLARLPPQPAADPAEAGSETRGETAPSADLESLVAGLRHDLGIERLRNSRLAARGGGPDAAGVRRLQAALDEARRQAATLEGQLAEARGGPGPAGAYAHWEDWFRRRLAERGQAGLARAAETLRHQHAVLEEKERLITVLLQRLQEAGEVQEGPDDLKEIIGIGPVIEGLLHGLGITTFEELAALSDDEVGRIGNLLGAFRERIRRDRWVEQAADLARRRVRLGPGLSLG
ncbi:MAG: hypothetical protein ABIJ48_06875 [Actinomycetota bacterium]